MIVKVITSLGTEGVCPSVSDANARAKTNARPLFAHFNEWNIFSPSNIYLQFPSKLRPQIF
jgi:hypothetical protein